MSKGTSKRAFLADLHQQIAAHCETVVNTFCPLDMAQLGWQPVVKGKAKWSILQCFDHLNLTHEYYTAKLTAPLADAPRVRECQGGYRPSLWGGIYMYFSLNPTYSFPSPEPITPATLPHRTVLSSYLACQEALLQLCETVEPVDLVKTLIPIENFVKFNLGDCLKSLVYHDELHIGQALRVYAQIAQQAGYPEDSPIPAR